MLRFTIPSSLIGTSLRFAAVFLMFFSRIILNVPYCVRPGASLNIRLRILVGAKLQKPEPSKIKTLPSGSTRKSYKE